MRTRTLSRGLAGFRTQDMGEAALPRRGACKGRITQKSDNMPCGQVGLASHTVSPIKLDAPARLSLHLLHQIHSARVVPEIFMETDLLSAISSVMSACKLTVQGRSARTKVGSVFEIGT